MGSKSVINHAQSSKQAIEKNCTKKTSIPERNIMYIKKIKFDLKTKIRLIMTALGENLAALDNSSRHNGKCHARRVRAT